MTEETLAALRKWAKKNERMEFERDLLILRAALDNDSMTVVARAAGLSRTHAYRVKNDAIADYESALTFGFNSPEEFWEFVKTASTWTEVREVTK